jgi:uncharacterized protein YdeI (BOF family)
MKKFMLSILVTLALCAATAFAQAGAQGTQRSSPTMQSPNSQQQQPGMNQPGMNQPDPTAQTDQNTANPNHNEATGKTLKGCVESQSGQYVLETKKGSIPLTGQDVSAHVGHEVKVKGAWEKASAAGATSTESSSSAASGKSFNVSSVDMVSDNCKVKSKSSSSGMGSGSGTGTGTGAGTSNQPQ